MRSSGNIQNYNAQVLVHNGFVTEYNTRLSEYRTLFAQYERNAGVHNYILEHNFDRPDVYAYVQQNILI